jgi:DNA polymerase-1
VAEILHEYEQIWLVDFEYISKPGEHPDVVCLCARETRSGQTIRLWRDQLGTTPPYRTDNRVLFVCFAATAEVSCHLALGWPVPAKILDLSPAFRSLVNGREKRPEGKGLLGALAHFGLNSIGAKRKDAMRNRILQGWPFSPEEREKILDYCSSDIDALEPLLSKLLPPIDLDIALHWSEFAAVSAVMEHRGVAIDMEIFAQLLDKQAWAFVRDAVVPQVDAQYNVYVKGVDGEWHFNIARFEEYLVRAGIDWPRHETGKLNLRRKTFESMCKSWPGLEPLRQLRYTRDKLRRIKLAVGADNRHRTTLWPFQAKTSRTQPKAAKWIFSPAVWLRSLIKPAPGRAIAYIDRSSMEFLIAAALSGDKLMAELYDTGSPYVEFAKRFDQAPADATKKSHGPVHERYKVGCLGSQYGMQCETLAQRLGVSTFVAHEMLNQHRGLFSTYWAWVEDWVARALDTGAMRTVLGWTCRTGIIEFNARSIGNFPVQATGADILRIACIWANRRGIKLCAPVHDAVLIEAPIDRIEADVALMREIMRRASRIVLNPKHDGPYELRTDATIVAYPGRYRDKRGEQMWTEVLALLTRYRKQKRIA